MKEAFCCSAERQLTLINYETILGEVLASNAAPSAPSTTGSLGGFFSDSVHLRHLPGSIPVTSS